MSVISKWARPMSLVFGLLWGTAQGQAAALINLQITGNNAAFGGGPITTIGAEVNGSFVPDGAANFNNGRGALVLGNKLYYTELVTPAPGTFGPTDFIRVAPFNDGAGGSDNATWTLSNPSVTASNPSGCGVQDLAYHDGYIYALTGYNFCPSLQVWKIAVGGTTWSGPVTISGPEVSADGFTILVKNGRLTFLINDGDASCTYREYDSTNGMPTGNSFTVPTDPTTTPGCTGVDTADVDTGTPLLVFSLLNQLAIAVLDTTTTTWSLSTPATVSPGDAWFAVEDISLVHGFVGTFGDPNCHEQTTVDLAQRYKNLPHAASALGYPSVRALQADITLFCGN
jgi:hypothetical protein